jgi:dynein heavy chain 1, cytosolic
MDANFRKQLESALRFGTTLFIHDAENFDPLINPVLNRELRRTSGRVLITIGDKDIDFSPTFRMFLFTRDSDVRQRLYRFICQMTTQIGPASDLL